MAEKVDPQKKIIAKIKQLSDERKEILSLSPDKVLDRILASEAPVPLVHSFPEEDFYYLVNDIGPEDSLPLLAMASGRQLDYLLDAEAWDRDRIDLASVGRWLNLFLLADSGRSIDWLIRERTEFIEYYLNRNLEVVIREHDQDPSDFGDRFFTLDDTFYVRILDDLPPEDGAADTLRKDTLRRFLRDLAACDYFSYQKLLMESVSMIPAEVEEENYRMRNVRLAEKGFLPPEESVGVYQPLTAGDLKSRLREKVAAAASDDVPMPAPAYPLKVLEEGNLFAKALRQIRSARTGEQLQSEFAALCNRIIVADQKKIRTKEALKSAVDKAAGYLSIGLRRLITDSDDPAGRKAADWIRSAPLSDIFRIGFGAALTLKWRAEQWRKGAWFEKAGLPLSFWGEEGLGILGGLLIKKPLFYDNYRSGELYRDFASLEDIETTAGALEQIIAFDDLLAHMDIDVMPGYRYMTHKSVVLTVWARHCSAMSEAFRPIPPARFKEFFSTLFLPGPATDPNRQRQTDPGMKTALLIWLSERSGWDVFEVSRRLGATLERLFQEVEGELGAVSEKDIDPKYIYLFHLSHEAEC